MKKSRFICIVITVTLLLLSFSALSGAADVHADDVYVKPGKAIMIPLYIKNNDGIMGFRITVNYDAEYLKKPAVTGAGITANGLLNDSISNSEPGAFDIVWCADKEVKNNAELLILGFTVSEEAAGTSIIDFDYSKDDTFNEKWEPVELKLSSVKLTVGDRPAGSAPSAGSEKTTLDSRVLQNTVDTVLDEFDIASFNEIEEPAENEVLERVNDLLGQMNVPEKEQPESFENLRTQYVEAEKEVLIEDIENTVDAQDVSSALQTTMDKYGVTAVEDIPEEQLNVFVTETIENLKTANPELNPETDELSGEDCKDIIDSLYEISLGKSEKKENTSHNRIIPIVLFVIAVATVVIVLELLLKYKKAKKTVAYADSEEES